jgi:hypothetical protein
MEETPTLERVNDGLYRCSLCKEGFRIERNYALVGSAQNKNGSISAKRTLGDMCS